MQNKILVVALLGLTSLAACTRRAPSSEIPPRRDFPVRTSVAPCQNFYQYACSVVTSQFRLRDDRNRHIFSINDSAERILDAKKKYLAELVTRDGLSEQTQQLKDSYLACTDVASRAAEEKALVQTVLQRIAGMDRVALVESLGKEITGTELSLLTLGNEANLDNPSINDLLLFPSVMSLPSKEYYEDGKVTDALRELATEFFQTVGSSEAETAANHVVEFEKAFAKTYPTQAEVSKRYNEAERYMDRAKILADYPNLMLGDLFSKIPADTKTRVLFPESFAQLNTAFADAPLDALKDMYTFHALSEALTDGYPAYHAKKIRFRSRYLGGAPKLPERAELCTQIVMSRFEKELDFDLIGKLFPGFPKARFEKLANRVREAIIRRLESNSWLTAEGKEGALRKMRKARMQLASPSSTEEWDFLAVAKYDPKAPIANEKLRSTKAIEKTLESFTKARDWRAWGMGPLTVNAYYNPPDNKFVMLQGILQYPFFDGTMTDAQTLGAVGMVVGHELGHGFDDNGSKYNEDGVLLQWMPKADLEQFQQRTALLVEQFNPIGGEINPEYGKLTLGENIADTSGLRFAYEAAFPGNQGTMGDKRAFFLQYARVWCGIMRPEEFKRRLRVDPHAQTESRVNLPLMHQPGFYEAYGCEAGDRMYLPADKRMELW